MSAFTTHLGLILYEDDRGRAITSHSRTQWFVSPPLTYMVGHEESGERITVPAFNPVGLTDLEVLGALASGQAFLTDLGSIPKIAWSFGFSPSGPEAKAFVLHDWLYSRAGVECGHLYLPDGSLASVSYTRHQADDLLYEAMIVLGTPRDKAKIIHTAVRIGGASAWERGT